MPVIVVRAEFDAEAGVWYVGHSDLPGVHVEGATFDEFRAKVPIAIRDLTEAEDLPIGTPIEIIAHSSERLPA